MKVKYHSEVDILDKIKITLFTNNVRGISCLKYLKKKGVHIKNIII